MRYPSRVRLLVVQIPCWNEEAQLPATLAAIPRAVAGFGEVRVLVVDDGSTDDTVAVARAHGATVVELRAHEGLGVAFGAGVRAALAMGADVVVNTDADNQYRAADIPALVAPLLAGEADVVVGIRELTALPHYTPFRRVVHRLGKHVVTAVVGLDVADPVSGFRAWTRAAAAAMDVRERYSYTLETLVIAGRAGLRVTSVPVGTQAPLRPSRLYGRLPTYLWNTGGTLIRARLRRY